jgi:hypothetical protein
LVIWVRHPANRTVFLSDIVVIFLMSMVFGFLVASLLFGMETFRDPKDATSGR